MSLVARALQSAFLAVAPLVALSVSVSGAPTETAETPTDWVLVLDRSGSMRGAAMDEARAASHDLVAGLGPHDRFALVTVGEHARVDLALTADRERWASAIDRVEAGGGTDLRGGLALAVTQHRPGSDRRRRTLVVTDGLPNSYGGLHAAAREGRDVGARLDAVGLGSDVDGRLLRSLAAAGGGEFRPADASDLAAVMREARQLRGDARGTRAMPELADLRVGASR